MPEVTLLKPANCDWTLYKGRHAIKFIGGEPKRVPPAIALSCKRVKEAGQPIVRIADMPQVVKREVMPVEQQNVDIETPKRSYTRKTPRNLLEG